MWLATWAMICAVTAVAVSAALVLPMFVPTSVSGGYAQPAGW